VQTEVRNDSSVFWSLLEPVVRMPGGNSGASGSIPTLKALQRKHRDNEQREIGKQLVGRLEFLLPQQFRSNAKCNGAGKRSIGGKGRALTDVLEDVVQYLKYNNTCVRGVEFQQQPLPVRVAPSEIITEEVLFSSRTMLCFAVEMGGLQDWVVTEEGAGAEKIWGMAPWRESTGGNMVGHSFS